MIKATSVPNTDIETGEVDTMYPFACRIDTASNGLEWEKIIFKTKEEADELCRRVNREDQAKEEESILTEANRLVAGDRQSQYGHPHENFTDIAEIASALINKKLTAIECAYVMLAVKLGRLKYQYKHDSIVDAAGYLKVIDMIHTRHEELNGRQIAKNKDTEGKAVLKEMAEGAWVFVPASGDSLQGVGHSKDADNLLNIKAGEVRGFGQPIKTKKEMQRPTL